MIIENIYLTKEEKEKYIEECKNYLYYFQKKYKNQINLNEIESIFWERIGVALQKYRKDYNVKFSTFAYKIIQNNLNEFLKKQKNEISLELETRDSNGNVVNLHNLIKCKASAKKIKNIENKLLIAQALKDLNTEDRELLTLYYLKNKTQKEIAVMFNCSQANVYLKIQKVLEKMRKSLKIQVA